MQNPEAIHNPRVILYELNEVPWDIVDLYVHRRPHSTMAELLRVGRCFTTINSDSEHLSPWRTWPTLHNSMYTVDHGSYDLGQDPAEFHGVPIWKAAELAGRSVGLFGAMQSWPPQEFSHGGFYVPDTFSRSPETIPARLETFQSFNLRMTAENGFSADAPISFTDVIRVSSSLLRNGVSIRTWRRIVLHLFRERRDHRFKAARSIMQAPLSFDLFWRLYYRQRPDLSIFFTNHVAAMMHRFWGDLVPDYANDFDYTPDDVFGTLILEAMDVADEQLHILKTYVEANPNVALLLASSMGQGPIEHASLRSLPVLDHATKLINMLDIGPASTGLAMHPMCSIILSSNEAATRARAAIESLVDVSGKPWFTRFREVGRTLTFATTYRSMASDEDDRVYRNDRDGEPVGRLGDIGVSLRTRLGGSNTAYHIPNGLLILFNVDALAEPSRAEVDVLDVSPSILGAMGIKAPTEMQGRVDPRIFNRAVASGLS